MIVFVDAVICSYICVRILVTFLCVYLFMCICKIGKGCRKLVMPLLCGILFITVELNLPALFQAEGTL